MSIFHAIILGLVEGITEFLPVSSTGHLIVASQLLGIAPSDFVKSFEIIIQLGAIAAVVVMYGKKFLDTEILKKLVVAFIPTGGIGLLFYKIVKTYLLGNTTVVVWALLLGGIAMIVFEYLHREAPVSNDTIDSISYTQALKIGLWQSLALIPGVSRSAATVVGGMWLGIARSTIVEFSFLLAVPTMLAASGLDIVKNIHIFSVTTIPLLLIGFLVSGVTAYFAIAFLLRFIQKHTFIPFGIYRIGVAVLFWLILLH